MFNVVFNGRLKKAWFAGVKQRIFLLLSRVQPRSLSVKQIADELDISQECVEKETQKMCEWGSVERWQHPYLGCFVYRVKEVKKK